MSIAAASLAGQTRRAMTHSSAGQTYTHTLAHIGKLHQLSWLPERLQKLLVPLTSWR